ncbi:TPA: transcriptional regulator [Burkholderia multivorans]|uniref:transcriptional regulator n=1 Tax=Burkholderia multivorans TaxID=87883 RepID=UPI000CFF0D92|nr:helix-turn-helix domain-containing protein [Burkholderia multivorans]PRD74786.1 chaperone [Burkholderia multivorans]
MTTHAIERAAQLVGGQSALARKLGCTPQAVSKMCSTGRVPAERVLPVEAATDGRVTRYELRPDLYPSEPAVATTSQVPA